MIISENYINDYKVSFLRLLFFLRSKGFIERHLFLQFFSFPILNILYLSILNILEFFEQANLIIKFFIRN